MAVAKRLDFSFFAENDFKVVISIVGFDLTGETGTFKLAETPEAAAALTAGVSLLDVSTDDDEVPTSIMQAFATKAAVAAAVTALGAADPGADLPLYYEFRVSSLPGDLGSDAETTLLFGSAILKGSI